MKDFIENSLETLGIKKEELCYKVCGKDKYYQVTISPGKFICIEELKKNIYKLSNIPVMTDVSCVHTDEYGYCLMIEIYWE